MIIYPLSVNKGIDGFVYEVLDNILTYVISLSYLSFFFLFFPVFYHLGNKSGYVLQDLWKSMMLCHVLHQMFKNSRFLEIFFFLGLNIITSYERRILWLWDYMTGCSLYNLILIVDRDPSDKMYTFCLIDTKTELQ